MNLDKLYFNLEKAELNKWYWLHTNQYGKEIMTDVVELKINNGGSFEFNGDYTKFRRIEPFEQFISKIDSENGINIKFDFHKREDIEIDYSNLPPVKFTPYDKKKFDTAMGRK